jgi:hypothetical protein
MALGIAVTTAYAAPTSLALKQRHALAAAAGDALARFVGDSGDLTDMAFAMSGECRSETLSPSIGESDKLTRGSDFT